jgi:hypothetical protein
MRTMVISASVPVAVGTAQAYRFSNFMFRNAAFERGKVR